MGGVIKLMTWIFMIDSQACANHLYIFRLLDEKANHFNLVQNI